MSGPECSNNHKQEGPPACEYKGCIDLPQTQLQHSGPCRDGRSCHTTAQIYKVKQAVNLKNNFADISIPQNPNLASNNWNGSHQDSYCSESVGLKGPVTDNLRVIIKHNPFGFTPIMACNKQNQMNNKQFLLVYLLPLVYITCIAFEA